jgi:dihydrofolate reductase
LPRGLPASVSLSSEAPPTLVTRLSGQGMRHLYIDGGITIQRFLAAALIDEITITRIRCSSAPAGRCLVRYLPTCAWSMCARVCSSSALSKAGTVSSKAPDRSTCLCPSGTAHG